MRRSGSVVGRRGNLDIHGPNHLRQKITVNESVNESVNPTKLM